jgi:hypothetical protein
MNSNKANQADLGKLSSFLQKYAKIRKKAASSPKPLFAAL